VQKHVDGDAFVRRQNLSAKEFDGASPDAFATTITNDKELTQIDMIRLLAEQGVRDKFPVFLKEGGAVVVRKPALHALAELRDGHWIAMAFVPNELVIEFCQDGAILQSCYS
jgi:hypothetical protein